MTHVVRINEPDGSLTQLWIRDPMKLRRVLLREAGRTGTTTSARTRSIDRVLHINDPTAIRGIACGAGRTMSVVPPQMAHTRGSLADTITRHYTGPGAAGAPTSAPRSFTPADADGRTLEGYAAVFDVDYSVTDRLGTFREKMLHGAFAESLKQRTPVLQFEHGTGYLGSLPLGRYTDVHEDDHGLYVRGRLSDNWLIRPITDAILNGAISGMSIRFAVESEWWSRDRTSRRITAAALYEAGPVVFPASPTTTVGIRCTRLPRSLTQRRAIAALALTRKAA